MKYNYTNELKQISKRCNIDHTRLSVEENKIYGNKLLLDGQPISIMPSGKAMTFATYLKGIIDGCNLKNQ